MQTHTIDYVKRLAKKLKKQQSITHLEALELTAKSIGYSNWMHCQRMLNQQAIIVNEPKVTEVLPQPNFTDWLKKHKNRNSPLGDLSTDMLGDKSWPLYDNLEDYRNYLSFKNASYLAIEALNNAWKSYKAYLKRKKLPPSNKPKVAKPKAIDCDTRRVVYIKNVTPIHYAKRTVEKFVPGDKAWISWNGSKAIPVTITEVDERHYSFRTERPLRQAGNEHFLFLDEVRSTPELACMNYVS